MRDFCRGRESSINNLDLPYACEGALASDQVDLIFRNKPSSEETLLFMLDREHTPEFIDHDECPMMKKCNVRVYKAPNGTLIHLCDFCRGRKPSVNNLNLPYACEDVLKHYTVSPQTKSEPKRDQVDLIFRKKLSPEEPLSDIADREETQSFFDHDEGPILNKCNIYTDRAPNGTSSESIGVIFVEVENHQLAISARLMHIKML